MKKLRIFIFLPLLAMVLQACPPDKHIQDVTIMNNSSHDFKLYKLIDTTYQLDLEIKANMGWHRKTTTHGNGTNFYVPFLFYFKEYDSIAITGGQTLQKDIYSSANWQRELKKQNWRLKDAYFRFEFDDSDLQ